MAKHSAHDHHDKGILACGDCAVVERSACGKITLHIGPASLRIDEAVFVDTAKTLARAHAALLGDPLLDDDDVDLLRLLDVPLRRVC